MASTQDILARANNGAAGLEEADRLALLQACEKLMFALETPLEKFFRLFFTLYDPIAIRIAVDLNLVDIALAHKRFITAAELAEKSKADVELIYRILRLLVILDVFTENTQDNQKQYTVAAFGHALATGSPLRSAVLQLSYCMPATASMPSFFATNGYQNPIDARHAPFSYAYNCTGETYFEHLNKPEHARMATAFNETMALAKMGEDQTFVAAYPAALRLANTDPGRVLFVDVGGGAGHQILKFQRRVPDMPGGYVLQDLPSVLAQTDPDTLPPSVIRLAHDFFTPQPPLTHAAKVFYMRMILHDWPSTQALTILRHVAGAMARDSVLLIHE
ncbi:hypothetical protein N0V95_003479, partial [Ascochyta clinopodiicola]